MGLGQFKNGRHQPITPYNGSWAEQQERARQRIIDEKRPRQPVTRTFMHTKQALVVFDAGKPARDSAWDRVETNADVNAADKADREAMRLVQEAFWRDTHDINSHANCMRVDLGFMRRMVKESAT